MAVNQAVILPTTKQALTDNAEHGPQTVQLRGWGR